MGTTTDLGFKLSVSGSTLLRGSGTTSASYALATQNSSGGTTMVVNNAGNMLIGTTTDAGYMLDVNGTAKFTGTVSMAGGTIVANTYTFGGLSLSVTNGGHFSSRAIYASSGNIGVTGESVLGAGPNGTNSSGVYAKMPVSPIGVSFTDSDGIFNTTYKPIGLLSERAIITTGGTSSNMTNGVMLQVMGSTLLTSSVISNSIPATPNTAYGLYIKNTLVATNNNNRLIGLDIQPTFTPGSFTGLTQLALRVSGGTQIIGSGSTGTTLSVFSVDGSSGRLFDVSDDLSSTLFSVNTIAGLPVIEAFANSSVVLGKYGQNTLVVSGTSVGIGTPSPQAKLDVNGTSIFRTGVTMNSSLTLGNVDITSPWSAYTPTWTTDGGTQPALNNGTLTGFFKLIGKICFVRVKLNPGSTTTFGSGAFQFSLPFSASSPDGIQFPCSILNNGFAWYQATVNGTYSGDVNKSAIIALSSGGVNSSEAVTATHPITFGVSDSLQFNGSYEIA
jgi:hypothetical protein